MPPTAERVNTKWKNDRYRYAFKLGISRTRYRKFVIDYFQLLRPDVKMRCIEVTGCKAGTIGKSCIFVYLFYLFCIHKQLPFVVVRVFSQRSLRLYVKFYSITDGSLPPLYNCWLA